MVRYAGGSRYGRRDRRESRRGGRGGIRRGGGRYPYGGRRRRDEDDYYDEEPYYEAPAYGDSTSRHEQYTLFLFVGIGVFILIVLILTFAVGGGGDIENPGSAFTNPLGGYEFERTKIEREEDRKLDWEKEAMRAFQDAYQYFLANEYEDKEDLIPHFQAVVDKYPGTEGAQKAMEEIRKLQDRAR